VGFDTVAAYYRPPSLSLLAILVNSVSAVPRLFIGLAMRVAGGSVDVYPYLEIKMTITFTLLPVSTNTT
jgi:hypothetical protein